jgi:acyl transferase domain-containing protein
MGHLELAAGSLGLIKCVLLVNHAGLTPNVHMRLLNPHLEVSNFPVLLPTEATHLSHEHVQVGVSSFGFGGTNAHVIVARYTRGVQPE